MNKVNYEDFDKYINKRIVVKNSSKLKYRRENIIGQTGYIESFHSNNSVVVVLDNKNNPQSNRGVYYFTSSEIDLLDKFDNIKNNGGNTMNQNEDFNVAIVELLEDYNKKEYAFALFEDCCEGALVVINPNNKFTLGKIIRIETKEEYNNVVTKEVIAVVNTYDYDERVVRRKEDAEKEVERKKIEKEMQERIRKIQDADYYKRKAEEFKDIDPELANLLKKYEEIGK